MNALDMDVNGWEDLAQDRHAGDRNQGIDP